MLFYDENSPSGMLISKDFVLSSKSRVGVLTCILTRAASL